MNSDHSNNQKLGDGGIGRSGKRRDNYCRQWWNCNILPKVQKISNLLAGKLAECTFIPLKNLLIKGLIKRYRLDLSECRQQKLIDHPNLSSFFVRALKDGARPQPKNQSVISSPVDGMLYGRGTVTEQLTVEVKRGKFNLAQLLASKEDARQYLGGKFALLYLAPHNYHRIHFPATGRVTKMRYIPGSFYTVDPARSARVPGILAQNERVVVTYETVFGPVTLVLVGAALVGGIETVWHGRVNGEMNSLAGSAWNKTARDQNDGDLLSDGERVFEWCYDEKDCQAYAARQVDCGTQEVRGIQKKCDRFLFQRGDELGRFNFGSSVVMLLPKGDWQWCDCGGDGDFERAPVALKVGSELLIAGRAAHTDRPEGS